MSLHDDLKAEVGKIFRLQWAERDGQVVPEPTDLKLSNDAVSFSRATVLYADLTGSTALVDTATWTFAAEVYKSYLFCAGKIIRANSGVITSYDGDRVMAVFLGERQTSNAAKCALQINYAVHSIINPALIDQYGETGFMVTQVVGIDTGRVRAARTGVRGNNDIVWVGPAANYAAKLTELKTAERSWLTKAAYDRLADWAKFGGDPEEDMWREFSWTEHDDHTVYGSTYSWRV